MVLGRAYEPPQRRPTDLACHHLETIRQEIDDKGDQTSGGETIWTFTGATRYGRGRHKKGLLGDGMLRPSPNQGTLRLRNGAVCQVRFYPGNCWTATRSSAFCHSFY